jgi:hypothetical protein
VIKLTSAGSVITVGTGVTLTLWNITFEGFANNDKPLISVAAGGTLILQDGAVITGNTNTAKTAANAGGVTVAGTGKLVMRGESISGNKPAATNGGGGVYMAGGAFTMSGTAIISANTTEYNRGDGGVCEGAR